LTYSFRPH